MQSGAGGRRLGACALLLCVVGAGCHTYRPIQTASPGTVVRVHVPVTSALADPNAPPQSVSIEGNVLSAGDTLVLATETRRELGAFRELIQYDTLRLSPEQRLGVELREFSTGRSVVLGAAITGGAVALAALAFGLGGGSDGEGPNGPPPQPAIIVSGSALSAIWNLSLFGR